jgi:phosphoheptose isomerase
LRAIRQNWHEHTHIQDVIYKIQENEPPQSRLERLAQATRRQWEMGSEIIAIYQSASAADPDAAAELAEALEGRRKGMEAFASGLKNYLRPEIGVSEATAILLTLCLPEVYDQLVRRCAWSADAYQEWLRQSLIHSLLGGESK